MAAFGAAALHVCVRGRVDVPFGFSFAFDSCVAAVSVSVTILRNEASVSSAAAAASAAAASASASAASAASSSVVSLGLESRNGGHHGLHLVHHGLMLDGGVGYAGELSLHLFCGELFGCGFVCDACFGVSLGGELRENLVDDGDGVGLVVIAEGIGSNERLTAFDRELGVVEVRFEPGPGFVSVRLVVPLANVASINGCALIS